LPNSGQPFDPVFVIARADKLAQALAEMSQIA
jgi:hypothetical protein